MPQWRGPPSPCTRPAPSGRDHLGEGTALLETLLARHRDPVSGLLCMAADDSGDVILRLTPTADDAIPNAHSVALDALLRLAALTGDESLDGAHADALFEALGVRGAGQLHQPTSA